MLSHAQTGRSWVISYHLRDIGGYHSTVGYICYRGTEPWGKRKSRLGEVYVQVAHVIPFVLTKDRTVVGTSDKIERMPITQLAG